MKLITQLIKRELNSKTMPEGTKTMKTIVATLMMTTDLEVEAVVEQPVARLIQVIQSTLILKLKIKILTHKKK